MVASGETGPPLEGEEKGPSWAELEGALALLRELGDLSRGREECFLDQLNLYLNLRASIVFRGELLEAGPEPLRMVSLHQRGFDEEAQRKLSGYLAENGQDDPTIGPSLARIRERPTWSPQAFLRQDLISDEEFYGLRHYQELCRAIDIDYRIQVVIRLSKTRVSCLSLHRCHGAPAFSARERRLAEILFGQALRVLGWPAVPVGGVMRSPEGEVMDLSEVSNDFEALSKVFGLTERECEVARWVQQGLSNKEIGNELGISPETVKRHLSRLLKKSQAESRTELAYRLGGSA